MYLGKSEKAAQPHICPSNTLTIINGNHFSALDSLTSVQGFKSNRWRLLNKLSANTS
jgi:hypothetical protein